MDSAALTRNVIAAAIAASLVSCGAAPLERARDASVAYYATHVQQADVSWSYLPLYLDRRFGVEVQLASGLALTEDGLAEVGDALPTIRVYRRLFRTAAPVDPEEISALESPVDRMLAVALHCSSVGLPNDWPTVLRRASERGGYALTHAVLAAQWSLENGCIDWLDLAPGRARQVEGLVALLDDQARLHSEDPRSADVWLEAFAVLHYIGASDRVRPAWLDTLLALQLPDGGWPEHPASDRSSPHATVFALWVLLEELQPGAAEVTMIPSAIGRRPLERKTAAAPVGCGRTLLSRVRR